MEANCLWGETGTHLGCEISNKYDGMKSDIFMKRRHFIQRNCELIQEFMPCHPRMMFEINKIYNTHFTGAPIWNLFGKEAEMFEKSWNVSVRNMLKLDRQTHKYFIEPISNSPHLKSILVKRFFN